MNVAPAFLTAGKFNLNQLWGIGAVINNLWLMKKSCFARLLNSDVRAFLSRANIQSGGGVDVVNNCKLAVLPGKFRKIYTLVFCFLIVASIFRHIGFQNQILYLWLFFQLKLNPWKFLMKV